MPDLNFFECAVRLRQPDPGQAPASGESIDTAASFIKKLSASARASELQDSQEAVELLFNLALGETPANSSSDSDQQELTRGALDALLAIAGDSAVGPQVRAWIRELAFNAFEINAGKGFRTGADGGSSKPADWTSAYTVPTPLLALAIRHTQVKDYSESQSQIGIALRKGVQSLSEDDPSFASPDRYCDFEEIRHGMGQKTTNSLPFSQTALLTIASNDLGDQLQALKASALTSRLPQAAVLHHKEHWVALVISPPALDGKADVVAYDTLHPQSAQAAQEIAHAVRQGLGEGLGKFDFVGANVQGATNGCGPLCVRALRGLASALEVDAEVKPAEYLGADLEGLGELDEEALGDVVAGWRARMLQGLPEAASI